MTGGGGAKRVMLVEASAQLGGQVDAKVLSAEWLRAHSADVEAALAPPHPSSSSSAPPPSRAGGGGGTASRGVHDLFLAALQGAERSARVCPVAREPPVYMRLSARVYMKPSVRMYLQTLRARVDETFRARVYATLRARIYATLRARVYATLDARVYETLYSSCVRSWALRRCCAFRAGDVP